ncbi:MAG: DUF3301 domain-containing protein [Burkholderiales bacterium]
MEIAALLFAVALGWFWLDTLNARETALRAGQDACHAEGVQFLDWTVAQSRLRLQRNDEGQVRLLRVYRFEYSETGNDRFDGSVTLLGRTVLSVRLAPRPAYADNVIPLR